MKKREKYILEVIKMEDNPNFKGLKGITMVKYGYMERKNITTKEIAQYRKDHNL